jgi:hypothetical protein
MTDEKGWKGHGPTLGRGVCRLEGWIGGITHRKKLVGTSSESEAPIAPGTDD